MYDCIFDLKPVYTLQSDLAVVDVEAATVSIGTASASRGYSMAA